MPKQGVGLSLQDLNNHTAHQAHQADRAAHNAIQAATGGCDGSYDDDQQIPANNVDKAIDTVSSDDE